MQRDIYCDFTNGYFVQSNKSAQRVTFPSPYHEDNLRLVIHPLEVEPSNTPAQGPFSELDPTGWGLTVKIFNSTGATVLASQTSWTVVGNTLVGSLNCNTVAMAAAIGSSSSIAGIVEFEFTDTNGKITIQGNITILHEWIIAGSPAAIENETYLTESASIGKFVAKVGEAGEVKYWTSPDGTKTVIQYLGDDGVMKFDPVT